ncbi:hypothetical protein [Burkholderia ubonensis]|uniref:hypothetical protein n=1 Tax=Burkholderia ubonensis TaxID=101571 RepID=UPI000759721A|nr:hypothetical protein [Burkholderia ubonensis]KVP17195.1 hypothetical protein WJ84_02635 [Burkholderia ubonensis]KVP39680.1 hypothetical protein WJ87_05715 [Burkholderia ubonensis]
MRYIRFTNAAIPADDESPATAKAPREPSPPSRTFWALNTMQGKLGIYVAVRLQGDKMWVGIRTSTSLAWVKADQALSRREAEAWFKRAGFSR